MRQDNPNDNGGDGGGNGTFDPDDYSEIGPHTPASRWIAWAIIFVLIVGGIAAILTR